MSEIGYPQNGGLYNTHIAFSKTNRRLEVGAQPVISTSINTVQPCYGPDRERLVVGDEGGFYMINFPIEKEDPLTKCPLYDWRRNLFNDHRYDTIGYTSLYMLQDSNGII